MRRLMAVLLLAVSIAGCRSAATGAQNGARNPDEARALALSKSSGDARLATLQERAVKNPAKADLWIALGRAWVRQAREAADPGDYINADACADLALTAEPANPGARDLKGLVLLNDHRFAEARDLSRTILAAKPDDLIALGNESDALLELGDVEGAVAAVQSMVDLKPNLPSYSRSAWLAWLQGDTASAKHTVRLAIDAGGDKDPEPVAWVIVQAALIFWNEGDLDGADAGFDMALGRFPDFPPALVGKSRVAMARGDAARAVAYLEKAFAKSPLVDTAWRLGDARAAAGDAKGADAMYAEVIRRGAGDRRTLASFYATKSREPVEALKLIELESHNRGGTYTDDVRAWALYRNGRFDEARTASDAALKFGTPDPLLIFHAGAIRIAQGQTADGVAMVRKAIALNPKFDVDGSIEAQKLLIANGVAIN